MANDLFIIDDFALQTKAARTLYHEYAAGAPIVDYHCHLPAQWIAEDRRFDNLFRIWLEGDHYKWRAMRTYGVDERYCTGDASDWEKFEKWAETVPHVLRNPLYHWTHMELKRPFGISDKLLGPDTAREIWEVCNERLAQDDFSCRGIMRLMNVRLVCTTDDPVDSLEFHRRLAEDNTFDIQVLPAWRPDKGMAVEQPDTFNVWVDQLAAAADVDVVDLDSYREAIARRHQFFHDNGCRLSDHGIEQAYADDYTESEIRDTFSRVRAGQSPSAEQASRFKSAMLYEWALLDHDKGWVQQLHLGALRNNNARLFETLGPDTGFDAMGDFEMARPLSRFLDRLDRTNQLAKTILYNLNPRDNELLVTLGGCFQDGSVAGKIQYGSGWWFLDQKDGIERQLNALSNMGLLSRFVGMVTDSRSVLSYPRHEYFRRVLCNLLGDDIEQGLVPRDMDMVGGMVKDICYNNAVRYFEYRLGEI